MLIPSSAFPSDGSDSGKEVNEAITTWILYGPCTFRLAQGVAARALLVAGEALHGDDDEVCCGLLGVDSGGQTTVEHWGDGC